jgi:hypothetical protein
MNPPDNCECRTIPPIRSVVISIALQALIALSAAHCTYLIQYTDFPNINKQQRHTAFTQYIIAMLVYSVLVALGLRFVNKKRIFYANFIIYPVMATVGVMVALANKWIEGGFDDLRWLFTIIISFIFVLATIGIEK